MAIAAPPLSAPPGVPRDAPSARAAGEPVWLRRQLAAIATQSEALDASDRLDFERLLQQLRLTFLTAPFLVVGSVGPSAIHVGLLIAAITLVSYAWVWALLRFSPALVERYQLLLRVLDCVVVYIVLTTYHAVLGGAYYDSVYILFIVAAAATHGRRGGLALAVVADAAVTASRAQLVLAGAIPPLTRHIADALYYLVFFSIIGLAVAFLIRRTAEIVRRRELRWRNEIADRNRLLELTAAQLAAANEELEAFSYSVSHDLRSPLRAIEGFSRIVVDGAGNTLSQQHRDYLNRVRAATLRMGQLIDDLLRLSRVTRGELKRERVDLTALAREVAARLADSQPDRTVDIRIQEGITADGDARLLRVVLENLLGNAWKFTAKRADACITVGTCSPDEHASAPGKGPQHERCYLVRDNGAGFDEAYADRLFGAFQRLHSSEDFDGTGIGLATVQRIIHRHGGVVWGNGRVGDGATFYFTL